MLTNKANQSNPLNLFELPDIALNMVEGFCSVISRPLDLFLRPWHGSRYCSVVVIFLCNAMMIFIPIFGAVTTGVISMIPLVHIPAPIGLFSMASFAKLYFLLSIIHGIRIYRLMITPSREMFSEWENEPLPFFYLLPKGNSFWFTRIVLEPAFVIVAAMVLGHMFIFQSGLVTFLQFSAMALAMKNFCGWFRAWQYIRDLLDMTFAGPLVAKLVDNTATEKDLAPLHIATLPKDLPEDMRKNTALHIARAFTPDADNNEVKP
jgi:hypothetical protein